MQQLDQAQQMQQLQQMQQMEQSQQIQQIQQLEQSQQMQQKLLQEEQQLQQQLQQLQRQQEQLQMQMQQLNTAPPAVPQMPQPASVPQQYVQQTYSPALAQAGANVAPEIQTQQMTMPMLLQQPELARTCSSGSDISNPQQVQYLMHLPSAAQPASQPVPEQPMQYLMHLQQPMQPASVCQPPPLQQVRMPVPMLAPMPDEIQEEAQPDTPQSVAAPQVSQETFQYVAQQAAPSPAKEEKRENPPKSAQTEVSSGSTREESD